MSQQIAIFSARHNQKQLCRIYPTGKSNHQQTNARSQIVFAYDVYMHDRARTLNPLTLSSPSDENVTWRRVMLGAGHLFCCQKWCLNRRIRILDFGSSCAAAAAGESPRCCFSPCGNVEHETFFGKLLTVQTVSELKQSDHCRHADRHAHIFVCVRGLNYIQV